MPRILEIHRQLRCILLDNLQVLAYFTTVGIKSSQTYRFCTLSNFVLPRRQRMHDTFRYSLKRYVFSWFVVLAVAVGLFGPVSAAGQTRALGTPGAGSHPAVTPETSSSPIDAFMTYSDASYGTGGIGLRNRGTGVLHVSGVSGRVQDAYLYWAVLFNTTAPRSALYYVGLGRIFPNPTPFEVPLKGTLLGIGADPCWGGTGIAVFRAQVPSWLAMGNGAYQVTIASGRTDGSDPWVSSLVYPLAEGASLIIVGSGAYTVGIYDAGFTASTFGTTDANETLTYTLNLPGTVSTDALWDNIGADGQAGGAVPGGGRVDYALSSSETTTINSVAIAGPGGLDNDSDWNGSAGLPIPQLWDDTGHDIFSAVEGSTTAAISFYAPGDCVAPVSNVLAVQ
jgi:hypothetical protein